MINIAYFQKAERPSFPMIQWAAHRKPRTPIHLIRRLWEKARWTRLHMSLVRSYQWAGTQEHHQRPSQSPH